MMAVNTANALLDEGIPSHLCTTRGEGSLKQRINTGVGYLFLNKRHVLDIKALMKLVRYCKNKNITHIHAHSSSYVTAVLSKLFLPKIKIIWHDHYGKSEQLKGRSTFPLAWLSCFFSAAIAVNSKLLDWGKATLHVKNYIYIPNFAMHQIQNTEKVILKGLVGKRLICVANLRPQKDHLNLINAFAQLNKANPNWTLHLVGADYNDAYAQSIHSTIAKNNLQQTVFCYGICRNTASVLEQATIGVLSSQSEGLPVALLEYGLHHLPVVVTDVGECAAVVENEVSGLVVPAGNTLLLANAVGSLMANEALRTQFGTALNKKVKAQYSKNTYISTLKALYIDV